MDADRMTLYSLSGDPAEATFARRYRRDDFAAAALTGLLANPSGLGDPVQWAWRAAEQGEALLAELERRELAEAAGGQP